jgi:hypothetical protein
MDDSTLPSVPWSEYLNGDYDDEYLSYATGYDTLDQNEGNVEPNGNEMCQTTQLMDAASDSSPAGECFFPCDVDQAPAPQALFAGPNGSGEASLGK